jgi:hypothetical protein
MFTALIVVILFVCIPVTALAMETKTIEESGQSLPIRVKAVFIESSDPNMYKNNVSSGTSSVTTRNGITVTITGDKEAIEPDVRLVVREITAEEAEPYDWFSGVLKDTGTGIVPFDIYFEKDGQKIPLNFKIKITIVLPDGYAAPFVCYVTTDGKVEILPSSVKNGRITFETDHTSYFVLADEIKDPGDAPKMGDNMKSLLYISLMILSVGILLFMMGRYKKKSKDKQNEG